MELPVQVSHTDQYRALGPSILAFTLCFAVWTLFSILGLQIRQEFALSDTQLGVLMATPVLTGSVSRIFLGIWTDRYGGRWVFGVLMLASALCVYLLTFADSYPMLLLAALGVGLAGGAMLLYRRLLNPRVKATTSFMDTLILGLIVLQAALGMVTIFFSLAIWRAT